MCWLACAMSKPHSWLRLAAERKPAAAPGVQLATLESSAHVSSNGLRAR